MVRAAGPSRCSSPAPSCNISAARYGRFIRSDERARVQVEEWLFWQVGGLGPMAGQANHFLNYAPEDLAYAKKRYTDEVHRLFGVMNKRLATKKFLAGAYSIADMACWSWVLSGSNFQKLDEFPNLKAWQERMAARPAVKKGHELGAELRKPMTEEQSKFCSTSARGRFFLPPSVRQRGQARRRHLPPPAASPRGGRKSRPGRAAPASRYFSGLSTSRRERRGAKHRKMLELSSPHVPGFIIPWVP